LSEMNVFQFTHSDLDGVGCAVIANIVYRNCLQTTFVDYKASGDTGSVDDEIRKFLPTVAYAENDPATRVVLLISDITPSEEVCELIDQVHKLGWVAVGCYDHHKDKKELLGKYAWGHYRADACGTKFLYQVFDADEHGHAKLEQQGVEAFAQAVDAYDRWQLDDPERDRGETLNRLLWFLGIRTFVREFSQEITRDQAPDFGYINSRLHDQEEEKIAKALSAPVTADSDYAGHKFGVLVATANASQIGHRLLEKYPSFEYVAIVNPVKNVVQLRSRAGGFDVGVLAKRMHPHGGGHQAAAGFSFDMRCARQVIDGLRVGLGNVY